ncbi:4-hydroxy-tetrahydrodipicolinate reductase [Tepidimicrobium xylanilyticum]|uniref:4-hydroxy-tetrahydrodipicolinate reductase n=1 Tax=Tepidimicrobium xylanilyticum TaxID=1123352 RepID=A0A1H3C1E7_9FIRM|nr:4-hydroxy-tetrahydrodipicolinate reductase [Tepidimicrobium xylanilyticum]GMG97315.1 4-hydroxy-tetrahydrodipicolinate reductase [Tepidimicrobium xylanilyticum]SDX47738.1 dihydrodipicolinate reductase [Tepidimicrobium xylanilyticum]
MIKTIIYGVNGKMGQILNKQLLNEKDMEIVAGIDRSMLDVKRTYPIYNSLYEYKGEVDVIIDFSHPSYLEQIIDYSLDRRVPLVIATTGFSEEQFRKIKMASEYIPILYSSNMSLGINILTRILSQIVKILNRDFDIEIIEKHHNKKTDAPSGTAYLLADIINETLGNSKRYIYGREGNNSKRENNEIGIHSIRGGTIPGEHTIIFAGSDEIIELKHTALSKKIYAQGAIKAARFIVKAKKGFYTMDDIFNSNV